MCGISVIISKDVNYRDRIEEMTEIVKHRGPDASGYMYSGDVAMGHRRLKIIDLSSNANQPMELSGVWIVFNGELYNYLELREYLIEIGHRFETDSDTEVLLHAYTEFGHDIGYFLNKLRGMFAFVIYDENKKRIVAARDRFGIKPIYYYAFDGDGVAFASEIKQFTVLPGWKPKINEESKINFLTGGTIDTDIHTMFLDVYQIPPGCYITITQDKSVRIKRWYDLRRRVTNTTDKSTFLTIQWLLKCSIEQHLQSDVPVGSCLSGGIDSTSIVCMINGLRKGQKILTVTNRTSQEKIDEGKWVDIVQQYCPSIDRHDVWPGEDIFKVLPQLVYHQDSPIPTSSMYAQWCVFQEASKHVKVMLDGQGADEMFGGYHMFHGARLADLIQHARVVTLLREYWKLFRDPYVDTNFVTKCAIGNLRGSCGVREYSLKQITQTSLPALLHWEDRNSMAHSVEARVPFLDHFLVEYTVALPDHLKVSNGTTKVILREAMKDIIPEEIRTRRDKIGFFTPEQHWFEQYEQEFRDLFMYARFRAGLPNSIDSQCVDILSGQKKYSPVLWRVISYAEFMKQFKVV